MGYLNVLCIRDSLASFFPGNLGEEAFCRDFVHAIVATWPRSEISKIKGEATSEVVGRLIRGRMINRPNRLAAL